MAYLIPYTFIYTPVILLENATWIPLAIIIVASLAGVMGLAAALQGWMFDKLNVPVRAILLAASFAAFLPDYRLKVISALFIAATLVALKFMNGRRTSSAV